MLFELLVINCISLYDYSLKSYTCIFTIFTNKVKSKVSPLFIFFFSCCLCISWESFRNCLLLNFVSMGGRTPAFLPHPWEIKILFIKENQFIFFSFLQIYIFIYIYVRVHNKKMSFQKNKNNFLLPSITPNTINGRGWSWCKQHWLDNPSVLSM